MKKTKSIIFIISLLLFFSSCSTNNPTLEGNNPPRFILDLQSESAHFKFFCNDADKKCLKDLESEVEASYSKIISDLDVKLDFKIKVIFMIVSKHFMKL